MVFFLFVVPRTAEFCKKAQRRRVLGIQCQTMIIKPSQQQSTVEAHSLQFQQQIKQDHAETRSIEGHYQ